MNTVGPESIDAPPASTRRILPPGTAALCLLARDSTPDRLIERLRVHAPHAKLLRTNLSHTDEERLRQLLEQASKQAEALRLS